MPQATIWTARTRENIDAAFDELDKAFHHADDIDLGEDDPAPDEGVDPESPQGDLVAQSAQDDDADEPSADDLIEADESNDDVVDADEDDEDTDRP